MPLPLPLPLPLCSAALCVAIVPRHIIRLPLSHPLPLPSPSLAPLCRLLVFVTLSLSPPSDSHTRRRNTPPTRPDTAYRRRSLLSVCRFLVRPFVLRTAPLRFRFRFCSVLFSQSLTCAVAIGPLTSPPATAQRRIALPLASALPQPLVTP